MAQYIINEASSTSDDEFADQHDLPTAAQHTAAIKKKFRLSGKKYLLTYAQCPEDPHDVFKQINARSEVARAVGCIELHQDGEPHIHIAVEFKKKLNTTNVRYFDYQYSPDCESYHPNISPAENWRKCINYCRGTNKTLIELYQWNCTFQEALDVNVEGTKKYDLFAVAETFADNQRGWTQWCYEHGVSPLWKTDVWKQLRTPTGVSTSDEPVAINAARAATFDDRFLTMVLPESFEQCVVLLGPSGSGKTTWAINHMVERFGRILVVNEIDDLRRLNPTHKGIVFDEIRFNGDRVSGKGRWPEHSQVALVDNMIGRSIHCRNINAWIPANTPKLFTCTDFLPFTKDYQIERRCQFICLYEKTYEWYWS